MTAVSGGLFAGRGACHGDDTAAGGCYDVEDTWSSVSPCQEGALEFGGQEAALGFSKDIWPNVRFK